MQELIMERSTTQEIFMAALLSCTKEFKGAKVRLLKKGEEASKINVTRNNIESLCPSWASSELITSMIRCNVCAPVLEKPMMDIAEKVHIVKETLTKYAKQQGLQMPS